MHDADTDNQDSGGDAESSLRAEVEDLRETVKEHQKKMDAMSTLLSRSRDREDSYDGGHFSVGARETSRIKCERLNDALSYVAMKASESGGRATVSKLELYQEVFGGDDGPVTLRTVGRYCKDDLAAVPGMRWEWPGVSSPDARIDTNSGKVLKFSLADYQKGVE